MNETNSSKGMYGEPLSVEIHPINNIAAIGLCDAHGNVIADAYKNEPLKDADQFYRIAACVNALDGIPDPAKFVEVFGRMRRALGRIHYVIDALHEAGERQERCRICQILDEADAAIAAAKEVCGE